MVSTVFERNAPQPSVIQNALAGSRKGSFWLHDVNQPRYPRLDAALDCDLVVVGGGYCGLWTAILAKERDPDSRVVLLEGRTIGWAASGRNGGFVEASLTHGTENGMNRWPDQMDRLQRMGADNLNAIEDFVRENSLSCDFVRSGSIDVAVEDYQVDALREGAGESDSEFLDRDALRRRVDSPSYLAGVFHRDSTALVHPAKLVTELARIATERGVQIFERSPVVAVESSARTPAAPVLVVTGRARLTAGSVALATNVFPSLLKRYRLHTVPVYDYALMTEPLSGEQSQEIGWQGGEGISDLANQFHYYRKSADNRILFGGYDAVYHYGGRIRASYEERPQSFRTLASHFFTTFPQLEGLKFSHRWAGAIDTSTRFCPFFGLARQGRVAYAAGFTGLGVASTRFAAEVMLDKLAGLSNERTALDMVAQVPVPFPPEPAASAGIQATRWALDRADHHEGQRNGLLTALDALGLGFDS